MKNFVVFDDKDPSSEEVTEADCFAAIPDCMRSGRYNSGKVAGVAARSRNLKEESIGIRNNSNYQII